MKKLVVVALGGNALLREGEKATVSTYIRNLSVACRSICDIIEMGYRVVITHGNGPQVGNIYLQQEMSRSEIPPMPLDVCGAMSQGMIGYLIQNTLENELMRRGIDIKVYVILTRVLVDKEDPAFTNPTKPIGPFYNEKEKEKLKEKGWILKKQPNGLWRRVVPSPDPQSILEIDCIKKLLEIQCIIVAVGGGGVPVTLERGTLHGIEGVVDKDLSSEILASEINADILLILTNVDYVYLNYGSMNQIPIRKIHLQKLKELYMKGIFPPGSMGPKILSAIRFIEKGGKRAIITSIENAAEAILGNRGTQIFP